MGNDKWIIPYLRQYRWIVILSILLGLFVILFGGALMFTSGYLISKAATKPETILMIYVPIVGVRAFGFGRATLSYVEKLIGHHLILKILSQMRVRLYKIIEPQALFLRSRFRTGDILGALANDIEHLQDYYLKTLLPSVISLILYAVIIFSIGIFSISFALLLAILLSLLIFVVPLFSYFFMKKKNEYLKQGKNALYQQFSDAIFGISDWIFSGRSASFIAQLKEFEQNLFKFETKKHLFIIWKDFFNQIILGSIVILTLYWAEGQTITGSFPPTCIAAFCLMIFSLLESFLPIAGAVSETSTYKDSLKRLKTIESVNQHQQVKMLEPGHSFETSEVLIDINHLTFGYSQHSLLLDDFSLKVKQGEKIAIIGRSGIGKSTLLKLIQGALVPVRGEVTLNGVNAEVLASHSVIPRLMAVLNQKAYLFNTSVLNNIRLGNPHATDEEVFKAAEKVQLHHMIKQMPNGYETNMQETGQRFSGGERQRIALARILLQETPIVILDEPTIGLDPITEANLLKTIFETLHGKTIIWVTHHLIGAEKMDRILFIDEGKKTLEGPHLQLLEAEERYQRLFLLDRPYYKNK
jgi:ATP-binding cassette, subfamily C, bacterial CydC